jgi:adenine phosphoribosyltransferase
MTSTSSHPPPTSPDATSQGPASGQSSSNASTSAELASAQVALKNALRQYPDFPSPGILFEDICPLFRSYKTHKLLIDALAQFVDPKNGGPGQPDVVVGLDARGFLFGPSLALRLNAGFVPVRKQGKLPGDCITVEYKKEYGVDKFQMQADAIEKGQKVLVVDDIIATGESLRLGCVRCSCTEQSRLCLGLLVDVRYANTQCMKVVPPRQLVIWYSSLVVSLLASSSCLSSIS